MHRRIINGRTYVYDTERRGGRIVQTYWGREARLPTGWVDAYAELGRSTLLRRSLERELALGRRAQMDLVDRRFERASRPVHEAAVAVLEALGYHRPKRGPWRKRRGRTMTEVADGRKTYISRVANAASFLRDGRLMPIERSVLNTLGQVIIGLDDRADAEVKATLQEYLTYWEATADAYFAGLLTPESSAIERALARSATMNYMAYLLATSLIGRRQPHELAQRAVDRAHKRLHKDLAMLATIRKLVPPPLLAVQVVTPPPAETHVIDR